MVSFDDLVGKAQAELEQASGAVAESLAEEASRRDGLYATLVPYIESLAPSIELAINRKVWPEGTTVERPISQKWMAWKPKKRRFRLLDQNSGLGLSSESGDLWFYSLWRGSWSSVSPFLEADEWGGRGYLGSIRREVWMSEYSDQVHFIWDGQKLSVSVGGRSAVSFPEWVARLVAEGPR